MYGRRWTTEEDELLRQEYPLLGAKILKNKLPHSFAAICNRAFKFGLKSNKRFSLGNIPKNKKPDIPIEQLKQIYLEEGKSLETIARMFRISKKTLRKELANAGIQVRNRIEGQAMRDKKYSRIQKKYFWNVKGGYILIRISADDPYYSMCEAKYLKSGYIKEHRYIMAKSLGRCLTKEEFVHHINGIKNDNRLENLELINPSNHSLRTRFCNKCELKKEIRLLRWQIKQLSEQLQYRMDKTNEL